MTKWMEAEQAAEFLGVPLRTLKRMVRSKNPPPYVRPSERAMLFDTDALKVWQTSWKPNAEKVRA